MPTYTDDYIKSILRSTKVIAMVGASGNEMRPSYFAMKYLLAKGFVIHPINPGMAGQKILGQTVYASLKDVPAPVDMVDIFRASEAAPGIVKEALAEKDRLGLKTVWMQLSVISEEAAEMARAAGLNVVMDRCPKIEYGRISSEIAWMGVNTRTLSAKKAKLGGGIQRMALNRTIMAGGSTQAADRASSENQER